MDGRLRGHTINVNRTQLWVPVLFVLVVSLLPMAGCGSGDRLEVEGTVTLDGSELPDGHISFLPIGETGGPTMGGTVEDGRFVVASELVLPGRFRVEIVASRETGRTQIDDVTKRPVPVIEQYIPPDYNQRSQLTADIRADEPNEFEFKLTSK